MYTLHLSFISEISNEELKTRVNGAFDALQPVLLSVTIKTPSGYRTFKIKI